MKDNRQPTPTESDDVLVIGAGPVGLTAALTLANAGVSVTVVEKASQPGDLPRAISLQDESFRILDQLGLADALKAESLLDTGSRYFGRKERLLAEAKPVASRLGHPAKTQFDQPILEQILFDAAGEHPNITMRLGSELVELTQDLDAVYATIDTDGEQETLVSKWLIGADGGKSFVRQRLNISLEGTTQPQRWLVVDLRNEPTQREPYAEFHCDGARPYVLVPGIDGRLRIEYMLFDNEDADAMAEPAKVRELMLPFRNNLAPEDIRRAAVYVAHQRVAETYRVGRCFLVGDAAHLMPPFAGQGLNAGLRDSANIAWKLIDVLRGGASDALLDTYQVERKTHGAKMMKLSQRIGSVVMATNPVATRVRDTVIRGLQFLPAVHSYLANMRFVTPPSYTDGVAVTTNSITEIPGATVGLSLSQPDVVDASGATAGLDTHLQQGWALIGLNADTTVVDPYFEALVTTRVRLQSPGTDVTDSTDELQVAEVSATLTKDLTAPTYILVRPDRFVAAIFTQAEQSQVVTQMRTFIDDRMRTFRAGAGAALNTHL